MSDHHKESASAILQDLETLAKADRLCDWMFAQFAEAIRGDVVEIGAGIGTFSARILKRPVSRLLLLEPEPACASALAARFGNDRRVELVHDSLPESPCLRASESEFDFALCQNVLEHIADDAGAVAAMASSLRHGGRIGLLVPADPRMFGALDRRYGHQRRYTPEGLHALLEHGGLDVEEIRFFNLLGAIGWRFQNHRRSPRISESAMRTYEWLVRIWRPVEDRLRPSYGLSLVARARRGRAR